MKHYEQPALEVIVLNVCDIVATSGKDDSFDDDWRGV